MGGGGGGGGEGGWAVVSKFWVAISRGGRHRERGLAVGKEGHRVGGCCALGSCGQNATYVSNL